MVRSNAWQFDESHYPASRSHAYLAVSFPRSHSCVVIPAVRILISWAFPESCRAQHRTRRFILMTHDVGLAAVTMRKPAQRIVERCTMRQLS